ncbi:MAG: trimeric intracellular cation channel family protein [Treponemataceae bacterium]|nr:trimeric intracellular cation channel family protein [Treponemataceae bacterium]
MTAETAIFIIEILGTISFASSGAVLAIKKRMDLFGVCTLGIVTAVGGGLFRDIVLGNVPPAMFIHPIYTIVAVITTLVVFLSVRLFRNRMSSQILVFYETVMMILDTAGLGIFSVMGVNTAYRMHYRNLFLLVFVGMMTGVGGGLVRDLLAQEKPYILTKDVYAVASILGALTCAVLIRHTSPLVAMVSGAAVVYVIRALAVRFKWNLPHA